MSGSSRMSAGRSLFLSHHNRPPGRVGPRYDLINPGVFVILQATDVQKQGLQMHNITLYLQLMGALPLDSYRETSIPQTQAHSSPITLPAIAF